MAQPTTNHLREAITEIDSVSQGAFSEISTIAKLALESLETPTGAANPERMAYVLKVIWGKAIEAENYINCVAEGVACNYKDQAQRRRWDAQRKAGEASTGGRV